MAANGAGGPMVGALVPSALFLVCVAESGQNCQDLENSGPRKCFSATLERTVCWWNCGSAVLGPNTACPKVFHYTRLNCSLLSVLSSTFIRALLLFPKSSAPFAWGQLAHHSTSAPRRDPLLFSSSGGVLLACSPCWSARKQLDLLPLTHSMLCEG